MKAIDFVPSKHFMRNSSTVTKFLLWLCLSVVLVNFPNGLAQEQPVCTYCTQHDVPNGCATGTTYTCLAMDYCKASTSAADPHYPDNITCYWCRIWVNYVCTSEGLPNKTCRRQSCVTSWEGCGGPIPTHPDEESDWPACQPVCEVCP